MATLEDFDIQIATIADIDKLVQVFRSATNDEIYDILADHYAVAFRNLIQNNCGVFQVARLGGDVNASIVGLALFKLRFGGWRDHATRFSATPQHKDLHAKLFTTKRPMINEVTGDPVFTQFQVSLEAGMQTFSEAQEDLLSETLRHLYGSAIAELTLTVLESICILPQYQQVEGLTRELIKPVMRLATENNIKVVAYNRVRQHDYSLPEKVYPGFKPLYGGRRELLHIDTNETPDWKGLKIKWDSEFQLFGTEYGQMRPYPSEALSDWK